MCEHHEPVRSFGIDRRTFIRDFGKGMLGISVGAFVLGACGSSDNAANSTAATSSAPTGAEGTSDEAAASTPATAAPDTTASSGSETTSATEPTPSTASILDVRRVDLGFVSAYILVNGTTAAIVDTGVGGSAPAIEAGLAEAGLGWSDVGHVIVTHRHGDHVGSLGEVAAAASDAELGTGVGDLDAISAGREILGYEDGDEVFGLKVVATPGHTPGHIAVFDPAASVLVAGDSINGEGAGETVQGVAGPNSQFTPDMDTALQSVQKMADLRPDAIYFGHGLPKVGGAAAALDALVAALG